MEPGNTFTFTILYSSLRPSESRQSCSLLAGLNHGISNCPCSTCVLGARPFGVQGNINLTV